MLLPQRLLTRTDGTLRAGWKALLFLVAEGLVSGLVRSRVDGSWQLQLWLAFLVVLLLSWGFLRLEERPLGSIGLRMGLRWGWQCLAGVVGGCLLMVGIALVVLGLDGFHWERAAGGGLVSGAWLFLAVGLREELLFRGYAFQRLVEGGGDWSALGLAALYFAFAHWGNPGMTGAVRYWASLNIGLVGVLLGLCYLRTRSLALPIGLHLGWNWTQGSLLGFGVSGIHPGSPLEPVFHDRPLWLTGGPFGLEASLPCALVCGLAIAGMLLWRPGREA